MAESNGGTGAPRPGAIECLDDATPARVAELLAAGGYFWLNFTDGPVGRLAGVGTALGLHPLTIEDLEHFGQRAKIEEYDDYVYLVSYGGAPAGDVDRLVEVHIVYSPRFLLTVTHDASNELWSLHERMAGAVIDGHQLLHAVLDVLVDSIAPLLDDLDQAIEDIEDGIFARKLSNRQIEIHQVRRQLAGVVRVAHRQSESYTRLRDTLSRLPDSDPEQAPYFRDVQDHLIRVTESADSLRDRLQGVYEIYLAAIDNRQNTIMKQFTVIAGVFLPLNVLVGFFGMNFKWMVDHISAGATFALLGLALPFVIFAGLLLLSWRRGLFSE